MDRVSFGDTDSTQIDRASATLQSLVRVSAEYLERDDHAGAAVVAQIAAHYGAYNHPGEFASVPLEQMLRRLGRGALRTCGGARGRRQRGPAPKRILHVLTAAKDVGGDSRFVWRWIERDAQRRHSVALTGQLYFQVPGALAAAVAARGGEVHVLDRDGASVLQRAQALRDLAGDADVVFLHVYVEDIVPVIAFADSTALPPIVFVVQADHQFWTGASVCDAFLHLRESGIALSHRRRGIPRERTALLSIPLEPVSRTLTREDAKRALGVPDTSVLLLSVARPVKYTPVSGPAFAEVGERILRQHPAAMMMVVGPAGTGAWEAAARRTGGRLRALGQRSDTALLYQAADIYLDSFPFSSNTSLLEAGGYGTPLVSYFPYSADSDVLGPGSPGLDGTLIRAVDLDEYERTVSRLIDNVEDRRALGERTRDQIFRLHAGAEWHRQLERVYAAVNGPASHSRALIAPVPRCAGEPDLLLARLYGGEATLGWIIGWYARRLPYWFRVRLLRRLMAIDRSFSFSLFLPTWLSARAAAWFRGWRRLPGISRWSGATRPMRRSVEPCQS